MFDVVFCDEEAPVEGCITADDYCSALDSDVRYENRHPLELDASYRLRMIWVVVPGKILAVLSNRMDVLEGAARCVA